MTETFRVERSILVAAAPEAILPLIEDFHRWTDWSPFDKSDPDQQRTFSGAERGVGAVYRWSGKKSGAGCMEVLSATASQVQIKLDFSKPMQAHNTAEFTAVREGDATRLTWAMYGPKTLMAKVMGLFLTMDDIVGKEFEAGLADLKALAEGEVAVAA